MRLSSVTVKLQLPYIGGIEGNWQPDERERSGQHGEDSDMRGHKTGAVSNHS